jgi:hypothetical protein
MKYLLFTILGLMLLPAFASAHPGDTDIYGYHTCWLGYYECAQYGVQFGVPHTHDISYTVPLTPMTSEELHELMKSSPGYEKVSGGYKIYGYLTCKDGYKKVDDKCKKEVKEKNKLKKKSNSMSDPANNERVRLVNSLKKKRWIILEDLTDKKWKSYKKEILQYVPVDEIKKYAPDWFIEDNKL